MGIRMHLNLEQLFSVYHQFMTKLEILDALWKRKTFFWSLLLILKRIEEYDDRAWVFFIS